MCVYVCVCVCYRLLDGGEWTDTLIHYSTYTEDQLIPVMCKMASVVVKSHHAKQQVGGEAGHGMFYASIYLFVYYELNVLLCCICITFIVFHRFFSSCLWYY